MGLQSQLRLRWKFHPLLKKHCFHFFFFFYYVLLLKQQPWMSLNFQISLWSDYFSSQLNLPHCSHLLIHEKKLTGFGTHEILKVVKNAVYRRLASWMIQVLALNPSMVKNASKMTSFLVWNMLLSNSWPHAKLWQIFTLSCKALHTGLSGANGALWRVTLGKFCLVGFLRNIFVPFEST